MSSVRMTVLQFPLVLFVRRGELPDDILNAEQTLSYILILILLSVTNDNKSPQSKQDTHYSFYQPHTTQTNEKPNASLF